MCHLATVACCEIEYEQHMFAFGEDSNVTQAKLVKTCLWHGITTMHSKDATDSRPAAVQIIFEFLQSQLVFMCMVQRQKYQHLFLFILFLLLSLCEWDRLVLNHSLFKHASIFFSPSHHSFLFLLFSLHTLLAHSTAQTLFKVSTSFIISFSAHFFSVNSFNALFFIPLTHSTLQW